MGGEHLIPLKKPRSYEEQITLLRNKNLLIKDEEFAKQILIQTGYYPDKFFPFSPTLVFKP